MHRATGPNISNIFNIPSLFMVLIFHNGVFLFLSEPDTAARTPLSVGVHSGGSQPESLW